MAPIGTVLDDSVAIGPERLKGRWHILYSSLPMWLKGGRREPCIEYTPLDRLRMRDVVRYRRGETHKRIVGIDRHLGGREYHWRGSGWIAWLGSRWRVEHLDPSGHWMIIAFERSLVTPAGFDILGRVPRPEHALSAQMLATFSRLRPGALVHPVGDHGATATAVERAA